MAYAEPRQRGIELLEDLLARKAPVCAAHRKVELGRQYVAVSIDARKCFAQHPLGRSVAIDIGSIDQGNAAFERAMHTRDGVGLLRAVRKGEPGPESNLGDGELAVTQPAVYQCSAPLPSN